MRRHGLGWAARPGAGAQPHAVPPVQAPRATLYSTPALLTPRSTPVTCYRRREQSRTLVDGRRMVIYAGGDWIRTTTAVRRSLSLVHRKRRDARALGLSLVRSSRCCMRDWEPSAGRWGPPVPVTAAGRRVGRRRCVMLSCVGGGSVAMCMFARR